MTTIYLLDTSAVLAHYRQEHGAGRVQRIFEDAGAEVLLSAVSVAELARRLRALGVEPAAVDDTLRAYSALFARVVSVDAAAARAAFDISCGTPGRLPLVDALIAACAMKEGARLVHRDAHMAAIPATLLRQFDLSSTSGRRG